MLASHRTTTRSCRDSPAFLRRIEETSPLLWLSCWQRAFAPPAELAAQLIYRSERCCALQASSSWSLQAINALSHTTCTYYVVCPCKLHAVNHYFTILHKPKIYSMVYTTCLISSWTFTIQLTPLSLVIFKLPQQASQKQQASGNANGTRSQHSGNMILPDMADWPNGLWIEAPETQYSNYTWANSKNDAAWTDKNCWIFQKFWTGICYILAWQTININISLVLLLSFSLMVIKNRITVSYTPDILIKMTILNQDCPSNQTNTESRLTWFQVGYFENGTRLGIWNVSQQMPQQSLFAWIRKIHWKK